MELSQKGARERFRLYPSSGSFRVQWAAKAGASPTSLLMSTPGDRVTGLGAMWINTCNLVNEFRMKTWINGDLVYNYNPGTGNSAWASTFQDETRDTSYEDTIHGTTDSTPSNIASGNALTGFIAVVDHALSDTEVASLTEAHRKGVTSIYTDDVTCQTYNQFSLPSQVVVTWPAIKGYDFTNKAVPADYPSISLGADYSNRAVGTGQYMYRSLPNDWKVQDFTFSILVKSYNSVASREVIAAFLPVDWNGSARKGVVITAHNTNGLGYEIGTGGASMITNNSGTPNISSTSTIYHVCLTVDSIAGVTLYLNGSNVCDSGGTPYTIDWTDGTPGAPNVATAFINIDTTTGDPASANGTTFEGYYNDFSFWTRALSSAEVLNIYRRTTGVVV